MIPLTREPLKNQDVAKVGMEARPYVSVVPGVQGGVPCLNNTRLPVEAIAGYWWSTGDVEDIEKAYPYPYVNAAAVRVCCWFLKRHGGRNWRKRLASWNPDGWGIYDDSSPMPPWEGDAQ